MIEKDDRPGVAKFVELLLHRLNCPFTVQRQPDYGCMAFVEQGLNC